MRILDEAEQLFAGKGYEGASLAAVADRVGIRGPSLFSHFKSKRALYEAVLGRLLAPFFAMLDELAAEPDSDDRARQAVDRMIAHHAAHPQLAALIQQAVLAGGEQLDWLIERWYAPFFARLPGLMPESASGAGDAAAAGRDYAAEIMAFNSLILGYVTLAPLHARLLGVDPLGAEVLGRYRALLGQIVDRGAGSAGA